MRDEIIRRHGNLESLLNLAWNTKLKWFRYISRKEGQLVKKTVPGTVEEGDNGFWINDIKDWMGR